MMYDDIANNPSNPHPGVVVNTLGGPNVYVSIPKYYTGGSVTPQVFLNVLTGTPNQPAGPVLKSGPNDDVFIFLCDHGASQIFAFPSQYLYADQLMTALNAMYTKKMYNKIVFYLEACESGSMFSGLLSSTTNVYAMTASNPQESSYACCLDPSTSIWLNDCWSYAWINDTEKVGTKQSLKKQFTDVAAIVSESHVCQYGDFQWLTEQIGDFLTYENSEVEPTSNVRDSGCLLASADNRDADFVALKYLAGRSNSLELQQKLREEEASRALVDSRINSLVNLVVEKTFGSKSTLVNTVLQGTLYHNPQNIDWECYRSVVDSYEGQCGKFTYYGMKYLRVLQNLCALDISPEMVSEVAQTACA